MPTFSDLPFEIRAMIWRWTVEPRTVEIRVRPHMGQGKGKLTHMYYLTPVPAPLQTCREARNLGLYKQAFSEVEALANDGTERRHVWLNLEIDIISIGKGVLYWFGPVAASIRRLRVERENMYEAFFDNEYAEIQPFVNLKELHIVCGDGMETWHGFTRYEHFWSCGVEDVTFIDPFDGRVMKSLDMDRMFDEMGVEEVKRRRLEMERRLRWGDTHTWE